ncbi:hypothetical protein HK098_000584 [Nowakowskiella sp. JEL0407]|nr:hypothetical protein HK098_000584 [Nowakowskiella sp. JEL0407]
MNNPLDFDFSLLDNLDPTLFSDISLQNDFENLLSLDLNLPFDPASSLPDFTALPQNVVTPPSIPVIPPPKKQKKQPKPKKTSSKENEQRNPANVIPNAPTQSSANQPQQPSQQDILDFMQLLTQQNVPAIALNPQISSEIQLPPVVPIVPLVNQIAPPNLPFNFTTPVLFVPPPNLQPPISQNLQQYPQQPPTTQPTFQSMMNVLTPEKRPIPTSGPHILPKPIWMQDQKNSLNRPLDLQEKHDLLVENNNKRLMKMLPNGLVALPEFGHESINAILNVNRVLLKIITEYQNNAWTHLPEFKIYTQRLVSNLAYLSAMHSSMKVKAIEKEEPPKLTAKKPVTSKKPKSNVKAPAKNTVPVKATAPTSIKSSDSKNGKETAKPSTTTKAVTSAKKVSKVLNIEPVQDLPPPTCLIDENPKLENSTSNVPYNPLPPFKVPAEHQEYVSEFLQKCGIVPGGTPVSEDVSRMMWDSKVRFRGVLQQSVEDEIIDLVEESESESDGCESEDGDEVDGEEKVDSVIVIDDEDDDDEEDADYDDEQALLEADSFLEFDDELLSSEI